MEHIQIGLQRRKISLEEILLLQNLFVDRGAPFMYECLQISARSRAKYITVKYVCHHHYAVHYHSHQQHHHQSIMIVTFISYHQVS